MNKCVHGVEINGDGCDLCWEASIADCFCRECGGRSYYESDFKHLTSCRIEAIVPQAFPNWRGVNPGNPRQLTKGIKNVETIEAADQQHS